LEIQRLWYVTIPGHREKVVVGTARTITALFLEFGEIIRRKEGKITKKG
jgi:hypothetical protein